MDNNKKNQLHTLLAVVGDLKTKANLITEEGITTFTKKPEHFDGVQKIYKAIETGKEDTPPEIKNIVTTVKEKLDYVQTSLINGINAVLSMEETNASGTTKTSLIVNGETFGELSATSLLALEKWLEQVRTLYKSIPTLDPTKSWDKDKAADQPGIYKSPEEIKYHTAKKQKPIVLYEATKEHPAQVQMFSYDDRVEKSITTYISGRITPAQKSEMLGRIDVLIVAVKKTRAIANTAEIINTKLGKQLFAFIDGNTLKSV